jgi:type IV secretion system protein VirD4
LTYPGSCIVTDPKGENAAITARRRRELGATVHIFDPFSVLAQAHASTDASDDRAADAAPDAIPVTAAFNPMDLIDGVVHGDGIDANDDARMLADMLVVVDGKEIGEQAFWHEEARALLSGLILHVATAAPPEARHLPRVRELLTLPPDEFDVLLQEMSASDAAHGLVRRAAARVLQKAEKERSGVVSSAQSHTHFLDSPRMADVLSTSTVDLTALRSGCVTCYLILPPERLGTYHRWLRLMIACGILTMTRHAGRRRQPRPAHRVLFLLDEFAHLGRMAPIERDLALVGGYGASFWLVLQDLGQLKATYPEKWSSMLANAEVLQAFAVNDWDTADYLSKLTGEATVLVESDNVSRSRSHGKSSGSQESAAQTVSEKARRLLLPDEIRRLGPKQLLFGRGVAPVIADLHDYRYELARHADPNPLVD